MSSTKPLSQLSAGQRLGPYTIEHLIGRGRKTEVYRASRTGARRDVAIKAFLPGIIRGPAHATCFQEEAARMASIVHPNIARVYDFGFDANRQIYYLAMELFEGATLRDEISRHPTGMDREEAMRLFRPVVDAVAHAHEQAMVHSDIKPENVLLNADGRPALTDFGIACLEPDGAAIDGTARPSALAYWSPEQIAGVTPTPASDIYALGILLHELATGDVPFKGETRDAIVTQHLYEPPTPPSQLKVGLDPRIERAILTALHKRPADRFSAAGDMIAALDSADADDYATLTLDKRTTREVRRRQAEIVAAKLPRPEPPETASDPPPAAEPDRRLVWILAALAVVLAAALAFALL